MCQKCNIVFHVLLYLQKEVRKVYKNLIEEDENFEGWTLGHGYVHVQVYVFINSVPVRA